MTISSITALQLTNNAISLTDQQELQQEVSSTEIAIKNAAGNGLYKIIYNARIIGNPINDPNSDADLTALQISYRNAFRDSGFVLSRDILTGYWVLSWEETGAEQLVSVYSVRTILTPGSISASTVTAIQNYFTTVVPTVKSKTTFININGGDILETDFNATNSIFYEYVVVVQQPLTTDYSSGIKSALAASSLGYIISGGSKNVEVYKIV